MLVSASTRSKDAYEASEPTFRELGSFQLEWLWSLEACIKDIKSIG